MANVSKKEIRFFEICERLSQKSNSPRFKLGAIVVEKNRIIGLGWNQIKTNPKSSHKWSMRHAEFNAILNTQREDLNGCELYVFRRGLDKKIHIAKPCESCNNIIRQMGISKIHYSINDGYNSEDL